jgi:hypothetical protein
VINPESNLIGSFDLNSLLSLILPFSTANHSPIFINDISSRNIYFSLVGLILFFWGIRKNKNLALPLFFSGMLLLFFSLGEPYKPWIFDNLPFFSFIRTNGEYCVFFILSCCCIAGFGFREFLTNKRSTRMFKLVFYGLAIISMTSIVIVIKMNYGKINFFINNLFLQNGFISKIKFVLTTISLAECLLISLLISFTICIVIILRKNYSEFFLTTVVIVDLIVNTILYLPVTGVGQTTLSDIQKIYSRSEKGITIPKLVPINKIDTLDAKTTGLVGSLSYYDKQIGTLKLALYPSFFGSTKRFFHSADANLILKKPFLFLKSNINDSIKRENISILEFSPTHILLSVEAASNDTLILLQNHYKFWSSLVNQKEIKITNAYYSFMAVPLKKGMNKVEYNYHDPWLKVYLVISALFFLVNFFFYLKK